MLRRKVYCTSQPRSIYLPYCPPKPACHAVPPRMLKPCVPPSRQPDLAPPHASARGCRRASGPLTACQCHAFGSQRGFLVRSGASSDLQKNRRKQVCASIVHVRRDVYTCAFIGCVCTHTEVRTVIIYINDSVSRCPAKRNAWIVVRPSDS